MIPPLVFASVLAALTAATPDQGRARLEELQAEQEAAEAREAELAAQAEETAEDIAGLQQDMVSLGDQIAELERRATEAEDALAELGPQEAEAAAALEADREALMQVIAALQRAEMRKPPPLAVNPDDAAGAARSAILLGAIAPALEARAEEVRLRIAALADLREQLAAEQAALGTAQEALDEQRVALNAAIDERSALEQRLRAGAQAEADTAKRIADEADDLNDLIARLEAEAEARRRAEAEARERAARERAERERAARAAAAEIPPAELRIGSEPEPLGPPPTHFAEARGALRAPAEGRVIAAFGAPRTAGSSEGISIETRPRAQVVSPFDARIEFADNFGNYGRMLILSVGDGYHIVLAGLERLYAVQGQAVLAGEPLGEMADQTDPAPELYYEIRRDGAPLDPLPWMRSGARAG